MWPPPANMAGPRDTTTADLVLGAARAGAASDTRAVRFIRENPQKFNAALTLGARPMISSAAMRSPLKIASKGV